MQFMKNERYLNVSHGLETPKLFVLVDFQHVYLKKNDALNAL